MDLSNIRTAARALLRRPIYALTVIGVLGLGIGLNSAMFSLVDSLLFKPLPVSQPEQLVRLFRTSPDPADEGVVHRDNWAFTDYRAMGETMATVGSLAVFADWIGVHVGDGEGTPELATAAVVSGSYFEVLGAPAAQGRTFAGDELALWGAQREVVLGHRLWQQRYGGEDVIGRSLEVNGQPYLIVGVMPPGFTGANRDQVPELWLPIAMFEEILPSWAAYADIRTQQGFSWLDVIARRSAGATTQQVSAELSVVADRFRDDQDSMSGVAVELEAASVDAYGGDVRDLSWLLGAVVVLVLLIACTDAGGLMLVRAQERSHETAVRLGLGAPPQRIVREFLLEGLLLALAAAAFGLLVAHWALALLPVAVPRGLPIPIEVAAGVVDLRVFGYTAGVALFAALLVAGVPAWRAARVPMLAALKRDARSIGGAGRLLDLRNGFIVMQLALSTVLLIGAALFTRSLMNGVSVDPGFPVQGAYVARTDLTRQGYDEAGARALQRRLIDNLSATPGIDAVATATSIPVQSGGMRSTLRPVRMEGGAPAGFPEQGTNVDINQITPDYFDALGLQMQLGQQFSWADVEDGASVAIVNRAFVEAFWPDADPIGLEVDGYGGPRRIVGVVSDNLQRSLREEARPIMFVPDLSERTSLLVRSDLPGAQVMERVRTVVRQLDPRLPIYSLRSLEEHIGAGLGRERMFAVIMSSFAVLALLLAAAGIYGVIAYRTRMRTREFGVRIAVGAPRQRILSQVVREGLVLAGVGLVLGLAAAVALVGTIESLLFGVGGVDPAAYLLVAGGLLAIATVSVLPPALRATRVQPVEALRTE